MSRPFLSHIFPSFQDPRPLTIVSLSDVCFFPTNQINWRPWTEIEGHWSGIVVSNEVLNSGSNWREKEKEQPGIFFVLPLHFLTPAFQTRIFICIFTDIFNPFNRPIFVKVPCWSLIAGAGLYPSKIGGDGGHPAAPCTPSYFSSSMQSAYGPQGRFVK